MTEDIEEPDTCPEILFVVASSSVLCSVIGSFSGTFFFTVMAEVLTFPPVAAFTLKKIKAPLTKVEIKVENTIAFRLLPRAAC